MNMRWLSVDDILTFDRDSPHSVAVLEPILARLQLLGEIGLRNNFNKVDGYTYHRFWPPDWDNFELLGDASNKP